MPEFIARAPWYAAASAASAPPTLPVSGGGSNASGTMDAQISNASTALDSTLSHQRRDTSLDVKFDEEAENALKHARKIGVVATKLRKGACENCGSMTHSTRDCTERPRAKKAKYAGAHVAVDEVLPGVPGRLRTNASSYDAKRDRWAGFDSVDYMKRVQDKRMLSAEATKEELLSAATSTTAFSSGSRYREDRAKYLNNLEDDMSTYDPKTRTLRGPVSASEANPEIGRKRKALGDVAYRGTGDAGVFAKVQLYAFRESQAEREVHPFVNPTRAEKEFARWEEEKARDAERLRAELLEKYGSTDVLTEEERLQLESAGIELSDSLKGESMVEAQATGGSTESSAKRFPADVWPLNHTSVWGSYWDKASGKWGYACCKIVDRNAFCAKCPSSM
eukprot:ANDGO_06750.mRNA.1 Pre-mRNA-splicing factor Slu7